MSLYESENCGITTIDNIIKYHFRLTLDTSNLVYNYQDGFCSYCINCVKGMQEKASYQRQYTKNTKGGFETESTLLMKGKHALKTRRNYENGRTTIYNYPLTEVKGIQEQVNNQRQSVKLYPTHMIVTIIHLFYHTQCG